MTQLAMLSTVVGLGLLALRLPGVLATERYRQCAQQFPRSIWAGRLLMGLAAAIAWVIVFITAQDAARDERLLPMPNDPLGAVIHLIFLYGPLLALVGFPVAYWLVVEYGNSFLAVRGAAALMLLLARLIVAVTDRSEMPARLVLTTLAYLWVVAAIWMAIAPHHFRDVNAWVMANDTRCRLVSGFGAALGAVLVFLGLFIY